MAKRTYDQFCSVARALDLVGERWTMLVVRELLFGPKRYTDLLEGLPGIAPNVLAARLKDLQAQGLIRRTTLPPPAASTVYELTELGSGLRPVVLELFRWGLNFMAAPKPGEHFRVGWLLGAMQASFVPERARGVREEYEFRVEGEVLHVRVDDGTVEVRQGAAHDPAFILACDLPTFMAISFRALDPFDTIATGRAEFEGDPAAGQRALDILGPLNLLDSSGGAASAAWLPAAMHASFRPQHARGLQEQYEFRVGEEVFHARVDDGDVALDAGHAERPAYVITTDLATFMALGARTLTLDDAIAQGRASFEGDAAAHARSLDILGPVEAARAVSP